MQSLRFMFDDALLKKYEGQVPRYTSYPPASEWVDSIDAYDFARGLIGAAEHPGPLSLYVHIPFCRTLCSYCGCNVVVGKGHESADAYLRTVAHEVRNAAGLLGSRRNVIQLHWGGGTPTFLDERQLSELWFSLFERFKLAGGAEVSVEVNPATCTLSQLERLAQLGFNRISFGVQDLDPVVQRAVRRANVGPRLEELSQAARKLGFRGINYDLIYGLPGQTLESWDRTLDRILELRPDRLAVYAFAFLPEQMPHQQQLDASAIPAAGPKAALFRRAWERLTKGGYTSIGMDHFALPDDELSRAQQQGKLRRNFQGYTAAPATDVVAFGPSAISDIDGLYAQNIRELEGYAHAVQAKRFATLRGYRLTADDRVRRRVIEEIMCNFTCDLGSLSPWAREVEGLKTFVDDGLVSLEGGRVTVTPPGRFFVRNIAHVFHAPASKVTAAVRLMSAQGPVARA